MSVRRFLVTAPDQARMRMWVATGTYANWIEGRGNRHGSETWLVTVFGEHASYFLDAARVCPVTVEEIQGAEDDERYELLMGDPGTGWALPDANPTTHDRAGGTPRAPQARAAGAAASTSPEAAASVPTGPGGAERPEAGGRPAAAPPGQPEGRPA